MSAPSLYQLLPELHRNKDVLTGYQLRALTEVLEVGRRIVRDDIAQLYEDWFAETCQDWLLPYIGTLAGQAILPQSLTNKTGNPRAFIGDMVGFRRREGTIPATERMLSIITGWPIKIDENLQEKLAIFRYWPGKAFKRSVASPRFASRNGEILPGCFYINGMGVSSPLMNVPRPFPGLAVPFVDAEDAPVAITEHWSADDYRRSISVYLARNDDLYSPVYKLGQDHVALGDLSDWDNAHCATDPMVQVLIDPKNGRLKLLDEKDFDRRTAVTYGFASGAAIGGGPYARELTVPDKSTWVAYVARDAHIPASQSTDKTRHSWSDPAIFKDVADAINAFANVPGNGLIRILDSKTYYVWRMELGHYPKGCAPEPNDPRSLTIEATDGETPILEGAINIRANEGRFEFKLSGIWVSGGLKLSGDIGAEIIDSTLLLPVKEGPAKPAIKTLNTNTSSIILNITDSIIGALHLHRNTQLHVKQSIIDARGRDLAISGHSSAWLLDSTILGRSEFRQIEAENIRFSCAAWARNPGSGACHYSYQPKGSDLPSGDGNVTETEDIYPVFVSTDYAQPGYARLAQSTDDAILKGGSRRSQIGVYHNEHDDRRLYLLHLALEKIMPLGIEWEVEET